MVGRKCIRVLLLAVLTAATATPSALAVEGGGGTTLRVRELIAPSPDWYTDALHRRVVAAAAHGRGIAVPDGTEIPQSALLFAGIRPGSWMISPAGCTLNYVFGSGTTSQKARSARRARQPGASGVYIGTAGHCTEVGDEVTIIAAPGVLMNIGRTVRSVDGGVGDDFALIEIHPEMVQYVNPSMAIVAGPTGAEQPALGQGVLHVGHGVVIGTGGTPRAGVVTYVEEGEGAYGWTGAAAFGDSGSPVRAVTGAAVGNLTHLVVGPRYVPAVIAGTSIERMLQIAGAPLMSASLVPDPLP